jgi:BMFP domain-containing protein YqiC
MSAQDKRFADVWYGVSDTVLADELKKGNATLRARIAQLEADAHRRGAGREDGEKSALDDLIFGRVASTVYTRESARAELAALLARIAQLEADVATMEVTEYEAERFAPEYKRQIEEPLEQRIAELEAALAAQAAPDPVTP